MRLFSYFILLCSLQSSLPVIFPTIGLFNANGPARPDESKNNQDTHSQLADQKASSNKKDRRKERREHFLRSKFDGVFDQH